MSLNNRLLKSVLISFALSALLLSAPPVQAEPQEAAGRRSKLLEDSILTLLNPGIQRAVDDYYTSIGEPIRQYGLYDAKILQLQRTTGGGFSFTADIQVKTFTGPHNPPYAEEIISVEFDSGSARVTSYKHLERKK